MKPNILFAAVTWNLAETTRMLEIAKACDHHFTPHFCGYGGPYAHLIEEADYPFHLLQPVLSQEKIDYLWRVDRAEELGHPFTVAELETRVAGELALYAALRPTAVVMGSVLSVSISARVARIPLVNVVPLPLTRPYLKAGGPILPNVTERPSFPPPLRRPFNRALGALFLHLPLLTGNFNKVARRYGLPPFPSMIGVWEGDYNLAADVPLLMDLPLPANWEYIGPLFANLETPVPVEVQALAAEEKPLIYFAMGSSANREVLQQALAGLAGLPVNVVAPIKAYLAPKDPVPPNVLVTDWLPALEVNRMADLAVIHGGQGTVQTACAAGKPFVGIGMQPEQEINIAVVERYGSAIRIQRNQLTTEKLQEAIRRLLADETVRTKAAMLAEEFKQWDGAKNGAAYLIRQFGQGSLPPGYRPMQNLAGERVDARPYLIGGMVAALLAGGLWLKRQRRIRA